MLGRSLRQEGAPHDCEQDAAAAMQLVNHALQHGTPPPMDAPQIKVCCSKDSMLFAECGPWSAVCLSVWHMSSLTILQHAKDNSRQHSSIDTATSHHNLS